jgi:hypothetical protein
LRGGLGFPRHPVWGLRFPAIAASPEEDRMYVLCFGGNVGG